MWLLLCGLIGDRIDIPNILAKQKQNDEKYQGSICMCEKNGKQRKNEKKKNYTDFCNSVIVPICSDIISETNKEKKEKTSL